MVCVHILTIGRFGSAGKDTVDPRFRKWKIVNSILHFISLIHDLQKMFPHCSSWVCTASGIGRLRNFFQSGLSPDGGSITNRYAYNWRSGRAGRRSEKGISLPFARRTRKPQADASQSVPSEWFLSVVLRARMMVLGALSDMSKRTVEALFSSRCWSPVVLLTKIYSRDSGIESCHST